MLQTKVTAGLGIQHPVLSAGMARVAQADLVAAVSDAGGMGCLGGLSYLPDDLRNEIRKIRQLTDKPFAVDLVVPEELLADVGSDVWKPVLDIWNQLSPAQKKKLRGIEPMFRPGAVKDQVEVILDEKPPVLVLTFNFPKRIIDECHARGMQVMALCGSIGSAVSADTAGVDYIVAQGADGGGHTGHVGTLSLVPAVVDVVSSPVIAAGGIVDGRGLAAALCLGAEAAWCGTRFIASDEAYGHESYKRRVIQASAKDTVLTKAYTGKNLRTLRNAWTARWEENDEGLRSFPAQYAVAADRVETGYQDGDLAEGMMPAGQGLGLVTKIMPAGDIVREMVEDAERILARRRA